MITTLNRRAFLKHGSLFLFATQFDCPRLDDFSCEFGSELASSRIGLVTDLHYADKPAGGSRHYRDTPAKLAVAAAEFTKKKIDFLVELGDLIDSADSVDKELKQLKTINKQLSNISVQRHYVLGNHCVHTLTKDEFLSAVSQNKSYYSFDHNDIHFVILDACFNSEGKPYGRKNFVWTDANVVASELDWLKADLKANNKPCVVFAHQRLDVKNAHGVKNAEEVRGILESSGNVMTVFQGHSHKNDYKLINGIHYCTLVAMVEGAGIKNNGFSILNIDAKGNLRLDGFVIQKNYAWQQADNNPKKA